MKKSVFRLCLGGCAAVLGLGHSQPPVPSELQPARELLNQSEQINLEDAIEAVQAEGNAVAHMHAVEEEEPDTII